MQMQGGRATDASAAPSSFTVIVTTMVNRMKFYSLTEYLAKFGAVTNLSESADRGHDLVTEPGEPDMVRVSRIIREERMETHRDIRYGAIGEYIHSPGVFSSEQRGLRREGDAEALMVRKKPCPDVTSTRCPLAAGSSG